MNAVKLGPNAARAVDEFIPVVFRPFERGDWMAFLGADPEGRPHIVEIEADRKEFTVIALHDPESGLVLEAYEDADYVGSLRGPTAVAALFSLRVGMSAAELFKLFGDKS